MSEMAETLTEITDHNPRVVAELQNVDFEIRHVRDDVAERYSNEDLDDAYQLLMANQVMCEDFKKLIRQQQCNAQTLFFEDVIVFIFHSERYSGILASFDYTEDFPVNNLVQQEVRLSNDE